MIKVSLITTFLAVFMLLGLGGQPTGMGFVTPAFADNDNESKDTDDGFRCPAGITTCYRADGSEYVDLENLPATAAGGDDKDKDKDSSEPSFKPKHSRSF